MKTEINEWSEGLEITFTPETAKETGQLLRFARNANSEKPYVNMSFTDKPYCYIHLHKRKISSQVTNINPETKH